jgi:cytochrome o ubiquinol oxidase subunit II
MNSAVLAVRPLRRWLARVPAGLFGLSIILLMVGGCSNETHLSFLDPQGPIAAAQRWHFYWVLGIMMVLVAGPIFLLLPFFAWRYRYGAKSARYTPKWKTFLPLEIASWGGPIVIVAVLSFFVWRDSHALDPYKPIVSNTPALRVQVIGYDWKWLFIYPDQGIASIGTMAMPVGRPVAMHLTSATVMQSFFIPALGSQIYAMGGMVTQLNLEARKPGRFLGENTMYNGNGFHQQQFTAVAMTPGGFRAWVRKVRANGVALDAGTYKALSQRSTRKQLATALPQSEPYDDNVYLRDVSPALFPAVVEATMNGTRVFLGHASITPAKAPATAHRKTTLPAKGKVP